MPAGSEEFSEDFPQRHSSLVSASLSEQTPCAVPTEGSSTDSTPASREEEGKYGEGEEEAEDGGESRERADDQHNRTAASAIEELLAPDKTATTLTSAQMLDQHRSRVKLLIENEKYLRKHHELGDMLELFVKRALEQQPENILKFAGMFFTQPNLREVVDAYSRQTVVCPDSRDKLFGL